MPIEDREFSSDEVIYWRDRLEQRKKNFLEAREVLKKHALKDLSPDEVGEISKVRLHPADLATQTQDVGTLDALLEKNVKVTQEIEDALDRLEKGTFGVCQSCGDPISRNRLEAIPEARFCLNCQLDAEDVRRFSTNNKAPELMRSRKTKNILEEWDSLVVSDIMQTQLITVQVTDSLDVAVQLMSDYDIHHLPVIDNKGDIQGILSDRDVLGVVFRIRPWTTSRRIEDFWSKKKLAGIMTKTPETVNPDTSLKEAGTILLENRISCLPVVEGAHLVGLITEKDFVKLVSQF